MSGTSGLPPGLPRLGFLGVGWIGRQRMRVLAESGAAVVAAVADASPEAAAEAAAEAARVAPAGGPAAVLAGLDELLDHDLDGLVVATPSALHAEQVEAACARGLHVFCQKPLGRDAAEVERVLAAARRADRLLGVDYSYRHAEAMARVRDHVASGGLGRVFAVRAAFHNAYGPDKDWFHRRELSGGGCLVDLGVHLVDLVLWSLPGRTVAAVEARCFAGGEPLAPPVDAVEDYATALLTLDDGTAVELACSWHLPAGREAEIRVDFFATGGGARIYNLDGSFYDFAADLTDGTRRERLVSPPDPWGGRSLVAWARRLAGGAGWDPEAESSLAVARVLDSAYGR
jgi:predicted dehydrogenase